MDDIKVDVKIDKEFCRGCLSVNRTLQTVKQYKDLFFMLLANNTTTAIRPSLINLLLCWECIALLRRIRIFQSQIQLAQQQLERTQNSLFKNIESNHYSLSSLNIIKKDIYDIIYNTEEIEIKPECNSLKIEEYSDKDETFDDTEEIEYKEVDKKDTKQKKFQAHTSEFDLTKTDLYVSEVNHTIMDLESLNKERCGIFKSFPKRFSKRLINLFDMKNKDMKKCLKKPPPYTCSHCGNEFSAEDELKSHWEGHTLATFRCDLCNRHFMLRSDLPTHMRRSHAHVYTCSVCGISFSLLREYYSHYRALHKFLVCDHCGRFFNSRRSIEKHIRCNHLPAKCGACHRTFETYEKLRKHRRHHHMRPATGGQLELCYCVECNIQFPHMDAYKRHLRTAVAHTPKRPVKVPCPDCGKIFTRSSYMNNHYRLVHVKESKHYCQLCDKYFINAYAVRTHNKYVHEKAEKPKVKICDICGRGFSAMRTLVNHRRTHTGERPYRCPHCPAAFAQLTAQKTHARRQHKYLNG